MRKVGLMVLDVESTVAGEDDGEVDDKEAGDGGGCEETEAGAGTRTGSVQLPIKSTPPSPFPPIRVSVKPRCCWR